MTQVLQILAAMLIGLGGATQTSMLGSLGRERGGTEGAWISLLGSVTGITIVLAVRAARGDEVNLPTPFDRLPLQVLVAAIAVAALAASLRGLPPYFAVTGLFGTAFIVGAGLLVPSLGVALFFGAVTAGTVIGALGMDHVGAFGATPQHVTTLRVLGVSMLLAGVVVVRSG
ncbi:MAG: DMT family transporter [Dehalococcoidia bacterium]